MAKKHKSKSDSSSVHTVASNEPASVSVVESPAKSRGSFFASLLPEGGVLPWWVVLLLSIYLLVKLSLYLESPCGTLGIYAPVTRSKISKAFRTVSTCTHPDKLISHSASDVHRGELLFKRASDARDKLNAVLRSDDEDLSYASCDTQLDAEIIRVVSYLGGWLMETGVSSIATSIFRFFWELCTFSYDISTTVSCALLLMTLVGMVQHLLSYIFLTGPITALCCIVSYSLLGPLPSIVRFLRLPPLRLFCFVVNELVPFVRGESIGSGRGTAESDRAGRGEPDVHESEDETGMSPQSTPQAKDESAITAARHRAEPPSQHGQLRHRRAAESKATSRPPSANDTQQPPIAFGATTSVSLRHIIERKPMGDMRLAAAAHIQFELLLSTTKYVIPLVALVATGQVFSGLWSSMITAQVLHKLSALRPEMQHLLILVVGAAHTLLCASKSQLHEAPAGLLQLQWTWSMHDVLAVVNLMTLGAAFSSASYSGNEPTFCASFAAGLALRMAAAELLPTTVTSALAHTLRRIDLEVVGVDDTAVRAAGGVGSCGGGVFRALLGPFDASAATIALAAVLVKAALLIMPVLAALQWALRSAVLTKRLLSEMQRQGRPKPLRSGEMLLPVLCRRLFASLVMTSSVTLLVCYFLSYELNAINASLGHFLVAALTGCLFESMLATYDLNGRLRQFTFFLLFMVL